MQPPVVRPGRGFRACACGQVLAEAKDGSVFIEKINSGGNADEHGVVQVYA